MKVAGNLFSRMSDDCRRDVIVHEQFNTMAIWDCKCINHILSSTISSINEFFKKTIRISTYGSNYSAVAFAFFVFALEQADIEMLWHKTCIPYMITVAEGEQPQGTYDCDMPQEVQVGVYIRGLR